MREKVRRERRKKSEEVVVVVMFKVGCKREEEVSVRRMYVEWVVYKGIKGGGKWCD